MILAAKPHSFDKAAGIGLIVLGFMLWWPLGLAILAYLFWSGKMRCWQSDDPDHSQRHVFWAFMQNKGHGCCGRRRSASSGNTAFDEYRDATLRRLEEDQREFVEFLDSHYEDACVYKFPDGLGRDMQTLRPYKEIAFIGRKRGTGGTEGVGYLQQTLTRRAFPEIWSLRTKL